MLAKGSGPVIAPILLATALLYFIHPLAFVMALSIDIFIFVFFRDPRRSVASGVCAAADGRVTRIARNEGRILISIFMNIHNVHVNRAPLSGKVTRVYHRPGAHRLAFDKDSHSNERVIIDLETSLGPVRVIQIAGAFARRIVPYVMVGESVRKGQKIGMIRFGSRVDVILPEARIRPCVRVGDRVKAGSDSIASRRS